MEAKNSEKRSGGLFWLVPVAAFLVVGGLIAVVSMRDAAEKLVGRPQAGGMSSGSGLGVASRGSGLAGSDFFSSEEDISGDALAAYERQRLAVEDRLYDKGSSGKVTAFQQGGAADGQAGGGEGQAGGRGYSGAGSSGGRGPMPRLASKISSGKGSGQGAAKSSLGAAGVSSFGARAGKPATVTGSSQADMKGGASRSGAGGVIDSLRSAWRGSVMGAREASNDAARSMLARSFDGSPSSERLSLQYDENMKKALDVVDPNSIPKFLRDQDLSSDRAAKYAVPEITGAKVNREGTEKALEADKDYQAKKALAAMDKGMLNSMFSGVANTNGLAPESPSALDAGDGGDDGVGLMSTPEDQQWFEDLQADEWTDMGNMGCGEECGCSCAAPCCCLPPPPTGCPTYGPFLPDDPCGADFGVPPSTDGGIWV